MTASANNVTVPGDTRLNDLKVNRKAPFWAKIPIIKELRVAVGWQKGMLITGLLLTAFFLLGELVEVGPTNQIFSAPQDKRTEDYISGRFG